MEIMNLNTTGCSVLLQLERKARMIHLLKNYCSDLMEDYLITIFN